MIGQVIKQLRVERGMTQAALYEAAFSVEPDNSRGRAWVSRVERDQLQLSIENFVAVATALDVTPCMLLQLAGLYSLKENEQ